MPRPSRIIPEITIGDMVAEGKCIARHEEKVIFVEGVVPGDVVELFIEKDKKSYAEGRPRKILKRSPLRTTAFCEHFGVCGGCKWQDLDYNQQLHFKQKQVTDALQRIGKVAIPEILPIVGSAETRFYRNKLEFTFSNRRWLTEDEIGDESVLKTEALGFHIPRMHDKILDIKNCYLQASPSNDIRNFIKAYALSHQLPFFDPKALKGYLRLLTIRTASTGQVMVILQVGEEREETQRLLDALLERFPEITSLYYVLNQKGNDTLEGLTPELYAGAPVIMEAMEDLQFRVGPKSFYQTNSAQAEVLYAITRNLAELTGSERVYDLYTGTGTIALYVAKQAKEVVGIEYVEAAIEDAKLNAQANGINHARFYAGDMKNVLTPDFILSHGRPDVVITDPPRAGMHPEVVQRLIETEATRIVYVSCNPATQARDLQLLDSHYQVKVVQPVDMFPHTHHVENVVQLERRS